MSRNCFWDSYWQSARGSAKVKTRGSAKVKARVQANLCLHFLPHSQMLSLSDDANKIKTLNIERT